MADNVKDREVLLKVEHLCQYFKLGKFAVNKAVDNVSFDIKQGEVFGGTNSLGQDIFTRLASGARFSLLFAVGISMINLILGSIYGAIEGYYGGVADLIMERISDILVEVPW